MSDVLSNSGIQVVERWVYPIKGLAGTVLDPETPMLIDELGVVGSRRFALLDGDNNLVTAKNRGMEHLLQVRPIPSGPRSFILGGEVEILPQEEGPEFEFELYKDIVRGRERWPEANKWLRSNTGREDLRLVQFVEEFGRKRSREKAWKGDAPTAFVDGAQIHIINLDTIRDVYARHGIKVSDIRRYKPDAVIAGGGPRSEHGWGEATKLILPKASFKRPRPLDRCPLPDVDPDTLKRGNELAKMFRDEFRMATPQSDDMRPCFGIGVDVGSTGVILDHDSIQII